MRSPRYSVFIANRQTGTVRRVTIVRRSAIIAVATVGKLGGTFLAAKVLGFQSREAVALGALMNARGTVELVLLSIGLQYDF